MKETKKVELICSLCGNVVERLFSSPYSIVISAHRSVFEGDLICEQCLLDLEKMESEEETYTRPAE